MGRAGRNTVVMLCLILLGWCFALPYFQKDESADASTVWPYTLAALLVAIGIGVYRGKKRQKAIWDSYQVTFDDERITRTQHNTLVLIALLPIGLMGAVYFSTNKIVVATAGTILLAFLVYAFFEIRRNKNIDEGTRKIIWVFPVIAFSIAANILYKLFFNAP